MLRPYRLWLPIGLVLGAAAVFTPARAAGSRDMATAMPQDTLVYIGWSQWCEENSPQARFARQVAQAIAAHAPTSEDEHEALAGAILKVLVPLQTASVGIGLFDVVIEEGRPMPDVQVAAVVDAGADTGQLPQALHELVERHGAAENIQSHDLGGVRFERLSIPGGPVQLFWGLHKDRFIVAVGENAAGKVVACLNGGPALADAPELEFDRAKVGAALDGFHFCIYADVHRIIERAKELVIQKTGALPPIAGQLIEELGIGTVRSKYLHADRKGEVSRMGIFVHVDGPPRGLLTLWQQRPLGDDDLKIIPRDAYWAWIGNLDLEGVWKEARRIVTQLAPDVLPMVDGVLAMSQQFTGFSLTDDLLPALGDTWACFDAPDHGGILLTGAVLVVDVKNAAAIEGMLSRTIEIAGGAVAAAAAEEKVSLRPGEMKSAGHTIHYVMIAGVPCPVAPAWAIVDNRLVLGVFPQAVAAALRQVDPRTRGESLLDQPAFRAARAKLPQNAVGVSYWDSQYATRLLYPLLTALETSGMSMLARYGVQPDLELMPPLPEQVAKTVNYVGVSSTDADGILCASVGDGGLGMLIAGAAGAIAASTLHAASVDTSMRSEGFSEVTLRIVGQACLIYANDNEERFPASLEQLAAAGYLTRDLPRPLGASALGPAFVYVSGQKASHDPRNVLAYAPTSDGQDVSVLFIDGHVEFMPREAFKGTLRQTYQRLGREREIPEEFEG